VGSQVALESGDGYLAEVEDGGCEGSIGMATGEDIEEMLGAACATGSDDGDRQLAGETCESIASESLLGTIMIHRGEKNLTCTALLSLMGPFEEIAGGGDTSTVEITAPLAIILETSIDGTDALLPTKALGDLGDELRTAQGGGINRHLVGTGSEETLDVGKLVYAATYREGDGDLGSNAADEVGESATAFVGSGDVEIDKLVSTHEAVLLAKFDRVAGIAEVDELNAFDGGTVLDVETGDDAFGKHDFI